MKCTACGSENPEDSKFCAECGTSLSVSTASSTGVESAEVRMTEDRRQLGSDEHFCNSCGEIIKKLAEICPKCGVRQKETTSLSPGEWIIAIIAIPILIILIIVALFAWGWVWGILEWIVIGALDFLFFD